jgi:hypothetical protein
MRRGPQTRILRKDQIERLEQFRRTAHDGSPAGYSYPQLRLAMGSPCAWETVQKALQGRPVAQLIHARLAEWIERFLPAGKMVIDGKAAAAGEKKEDTTTRPYR